MNPYVALILGLLIGSIAVYFISLSLGKARVAEISGRLAAREEENKSLNERIGLMNARIDELNAALKSEAERRAASEARAEQTDKLEKELAVFQKELSDIKSEKARLEETLAKEREAAEKQLKTIEEAKTNLADAFKALSSDALSKNNEAFIQLAKQVLETFYKQASSTLGEKEKAIEVLVQPLREALDRYEKLIAELEKSRQGAYSGLEQQVKMLLESEKNLQKETSKLVTALSAPQVRGNWGELTLRRVAELAGMTEHCDFVEQESADTPAGRLRPDMIVYLPNGRQIIVDAKAPLRAYLESIETSDEAIRETKLHEHSRQMRARVMELCKKEYWEQFTPTPEFAVLFLPGEQFLGAALQADNALLEDAFEKKIILATPSTLIALLKAVAYGWRQESLAENAERISELGKLLFERLATLASHFEELGRSLDKSIQAYNKAVGSLESRVLVAARKFRELGVSGREDITELGQIDHTTRKMLPIGFSEEGEPIVK